jgi:hypothetical protein
LRPRHLFTGNRKWENAVKPEGRLLKAKREEKSTEKLNPEEDSEPIIEGLYGAAHHYIAYAPQTKHHTNSDKHGQDFLILKEYRLEDIRSKFETLDDIRTGDFYGGRTDGERVSRARKLLAEIKAWAEAP